MSKPEKDAPVLSIIIPTRNRWPECAVAIRSVLANGFGEAMEIIVSDDALGDASEKEWHQLQDTLWKETPDLLETVELVYVTNDKPGKPENWHNALSAASGEFVFKLDDDDEVAPGFLQTAVAILRTKPKLSSVYSGYIIEDTEHGEWTEVIDETFFSGPLSSPLTLPDIPRHPSLFRSDSAARLVPGNDYARAVLTNEGGFPLNQKTAAVFRRSAAAAIGGYHHACEDFAFSAALGLVGDIAYFPAPLYIWKRHRANNINDPRYSWRLSRRALAGLRELGSMDEAMSHHTLRLPAEWHAWCDACEHALPLVYMHGVLRERGVSAARSFWNRVKTESTEAARLPAWPARLLLTLGALLPYSCIDQLFRLYRQSAWIRSIIRGLLLRR